MRAAEQWRSRTPSSRRETPGQPAAPARRPAPDRPRLQRCSCGGSCPRCRAKAAASASSDLRINEPGDAWEREADRIADAVMSGAGVSPSPASSDRSTTLRRCACGGSCPSCRAEKEEDETDLLHREDTGASAPSIAPSIVHDVLASPGRPLEAGTRAFMEERFGADFGGVRVHADARAAESARAVDAHAYAVGSDVVFAAGRYVPGTEGGDRLIAHELAHTLQQRGGLARRLQRVPAGGATLGPPPTLPSAPARPRTPPPVAAPPPVTPRGLNPASCVAPSCSLVAAARTPATAADARRLGADWLAQALACVRTGAAGSNASHAADIVANEETELAAEVTRLDAGLPGNRAAYARELERLCRRKEREIEIEFHYNVVFESPTSGAAWSADAAGWDPIDGALAALPAQATWANSRLIRFRRQACHPGDLDASGACVGQPAGPLTRGFTGGEADFPRGEIRVFDAGAGSAPYSRSRSLGLSAMAQTLRHEVGHLVMSQLSRADEAALFETVMGWHIYPWDWITVNPAPYASWAAERTALRDALGMDDTRLDAWLQGLVLDREEQRGSRTFSKRARSGGSSFYVQSFLTAEMPTGVEFEYARSSQGEYLAELYALAVSRPEFLHDTISAGQVAWLKRVVFQTPEDMAALGRSMALQDPPLTEFVVRGSRLFTWEQIDALLQELLAARTPGSRAA